MTLFILITLPAFILETLLFIFLLNQTVHPGLLFFVHVMVTAGLCLFTFFRLLSGKRAHFHFLLSLSTTFFGPFGIIGTLFSIFLFRYFKNSLPPILESHSSLFPAVEKTEVEILFEQLHINNLERFDKSSVVPFIDILKYGSQRQKQALIVLLINNYNSKFAPVLKNALNDKDNSLRVLAAMGIAQIENKFMKRTFAIENNKKKMAESNPNYWKILGQHYDEYAYSGILDKAREQKYRDLAISAYNQYLDHNPGDPNVIFRVGRMLLRNGKISEAAERFEHSIDKGVKTPSILFWYFESLYRLGQFNKLRLVAESNYGEILKIKDEIPLDVLNVIQTWVNPRHNLDQKNKQVAA